MLPKRILRGKHRIYMGKIKTAWRKRATWRKHVWKRIHVQTFNTCVQMFFAGF